jgi:DNA replication protein DnaC
MNQIESIACPCGVSFPWEPTETDPMLRDFLRPCKCPDCEAKDAAEWQAKQDRETAAKDAHERKSAIASVTAAIPSRFRGTDINHEDFNLSLWNEVKEWKPSLEIPFLGMVGESGASKTRVAYLLFAQLASAGSMTFAAKSMTDLGILIAKQFQSYDSKAEARDELDSLRLCGLLLLDDLGKARNTPSVAVELFSIIDHRHAHNLPTIWTANGEPEEIVHGMSDDIAGPLAGRLIECSKIVRSTPR